MGAEYLSYVNFIATFALTFYGHIISVLASVMSVLRLRTGNELALGAIICIQENGIRTFSSVFGI